MEVSIGERLEPRQAHEERLEAVSASVFGLRCSLNLAEVRRCKAEINPSDAEVLFEMDLYRLLSVSQDALDASIFPNANFIVCHGSSLELRMLTCESLEISDEAFVELTSELGAFWVRFPERQVYGG
ncbi:MAG: hypothetical protein JNL14_14670 [Devosia sp.]|uniref:hypothetical protein n=1 Tax=Devosia sp. TaxID=1871048 RepID=UPI001A63AB55|nr:hypothetical protein [Devosia sp.]MBL8598976.1 hypothetical protein [Devosia sp.]